MGTPSTLVEYCADHESVPDVPSLISLKPARVERVCLLLPERAPLVLRGLLGPTLNLSSSGRKLLSALGARPLPDLFDFEERPGSGASEGAGLEGRPTWAREGLRDMSACTNIFDGVEIIKKRQCRPGPGWTCVGHERAALQALVLLSFV